MSQQFCLKWNNHMNNMMDVFKNLLSTEAMVDVTLACDGLSLKAHRIVLSACSPFFQSLFLENPCKHPIVILKDMKYTELKAIIEFMYHGEVNVAQEQLSALMKTAETLRVKGLAEVTNDKEQSGDESSHRPSSRTGTPPPKRRKGRTRKRSVSDQSDDGASEPKIKQPDSDIEELSSDMDRNTNTPYSVASAVPSQTHRTSSFHKSHQEQQPVEQQHGEDTFVQEEKYNVEPAKLLQQTLSTDDLPRRTGRSSVQSNMELQRRPQSSTDHSILPITSTPLSSNALVSEQQPESPVDIKPELLDLEPPMSPVAGPSHSADENSMMYMDQSNMSSMSGPSSYQDSTALVPSDSQPQGAVPTDDVMLGMKYSLRSRKMTEPDESNMDLKKRKVDLDSKTRKEKKIISKDTVTKSNKKKKADKKEKKEKILKVKIPNPKRKKAVVEPKEKENKYISNDIVTNYETSSEQSDETNFIRPLSSKTSCVVTEKFAPKQGVMYYETSSHESDKTNFMRPSCSKTSDVVTKKFAPKQGVMYSAGMVNSLATTGHVEKQEAPSDDEQSYLAENNSSSLRDPTLLPGFDGQHTEDPHNVDLFLATDDHPDSDTIPVATFGMLHLIQPICSFWYDEYEKEKCKDFDFYC